MKSLNEASISSRDFVVLKSFELVPSAFLIPYFIVENIGKHIDWDLKLKTLILLILPQSWNLESPYWILFHATPYTGA